MPVQFRIPLRDVQGVPTDFTAAKTIKINCPTGKRRYKWIAFQIGYTGGTNTIAAVATMISEIRVKVNGKVQRTMSGTELRDANLLNGTAYDCTGLPNTAPGVCFHIFFSEPWRTKWEDQDALAWPTAGWESLEVEVDTAATASTSAATFVAWAVIDTVVPANLENLAIVKWIKQRVTAAGTSWAWTTLDRRDVLQSVSFYPDSGASNALSSLKLEVDSVVVHDMTFSANRALQTVNSITPAATGRTANISDLILDHNDGLSSGLNLAGARSCEFTFATASAASGTSVAIIQRLGPPE